MTVNKADGSIWNISDIEGDSDNWTLSSDVNMLNLLQTFSDNLLSNLNTSSRALEELITFSSEVSTKVNNTFNEFNMLSNAQFIESRVYEDDETHDAGSDVLPDVKEEDTSEVIVARIKTSVEYGLTVLDAAYTVHGYSANSPDDTVEDAGDEEEIIIEPNDPYTHRSLPFLIGSSEYCTDESVGITLLYQSDDESNKSEDEEDDDEDYEEEEDEEEEEERGNANLPKTAALVLHSDEESDEDSEEETEVRPLVGAAVPKQPRLPDLGVGSSSESEEMFPETKTARTKVFDSIFDSTDEEEEEEEDTAAPAPSPSNPKASTTVTREERSPSVLSVKSNKTPKGVPKGAISIFGGRTVFEGGAIKVIEDEESGEEDAAAPLAAPESEENIRPAKTPAVKKVKKIGSIFSDTDDSDSEGLFATKNIQDNDKVANPVVSSTKTKSVPQKKAAVYPGSIFDFTDDEEDDMEPKKPQSVGQLKESSSKGAPKASNFDLFDSNESDEDLQEEVKPVPAAQKKSISAPPKKEDKGLFESSDEETDTSLFGSVKVLPTPEKKLPDLKKNAPQKKEKAKKEDSFDQLFASSDDESSSPKLTATSVKTTTSNKPSNDASKDKTSGLAEKVTSRAAKFDDIFGDSDEDDDDTFGFSSAPQKEVKNTSIADNNKNNFVKATEQTTPARGKTDKLHDLFADSDDETENTFLGTSGSKNSANRPEPANPLLEDSEKDDYEEISQKEPSSKKPEEKEPSSKKQEEKSTNSQADKLKARAAKFDDIFGDSDVNEDDDMFTTPGKPSGKIGTRDPVPSSTSKISEREVPPLVTEDKEEKAANKLKQRAAKFDDLFADSDDDEDGDIFSSRPSVPQKGEVFPPVTVPSDQEDNKNNKTTVSSDENTNQASTEKIKSRSAKFDDLFADSDEGDDDIFADKAVEDARKAKLQTSGPDVLAANEKTTDIPSSEKDAGSRPHDSKVSSQSHIAKLQDNLNLSPDMLMGGPRPRKSKNTEPSSDDVHIVGSQKINEDRKSKVDKFDDLFGGSDDEDDIFADQINKPPKPEDREPTVADVSETDSLSNPLFGTDSSPSISETSTPKSNVAKLQSNLNISPEMLMGGPRPKKPKDPEIIQEPKSKDIENKTKARAAKFDDLFDGSDNEDIFSVPDLPKSQEKPTHSKTLSDKTESTSSEIVSNNKDKIKQGVAMFDDLFGESDEETGDIFAAADKTKSQTVLPEEKTQKTESPVQPCVEPDSGPASQKSKASPNSNIAKLQNNLKFNPAMLMGGPRPPVQKQKEISPESATETDEPPNGVQETEKSSAEPQNPRVLSSITKGRIKRGGRRPPSRAPNKTSSQSPAPSRPIESTESNDKSVSLVDSVTTNSSMNQSNESEKQEKVHNESIQPAIEKEDIFETPSLTFEDEDDIFAAPAKTKSSRQKITTIEDDDLFTALPKKKSSILEEDLAEEDDLFSTPSKPKPAKKKSSTAGSVSTPSSSKVKENKDEELFSVPAKSRDQGKKKGKTKKILDDDLFGDDFDLFSDVSAKPKSKKDKRGTKAKKSEVSKSQDFIDPLFQ